MANYIKATDFTSKDALLTGDPNKIVRGSEIDDEFDNIQTAVNSKADTLSASLTGTPTAPTAAVGTNTTQIATTAFVLASLYPVGSIYINASVSTNPATLFGFGTWVEFGSGKVLVSQDAGDAAFDTLEETGGSKDAIVVSHTHSVTDPGHTHTTSIERFINYTADNFTGGRNTYSQNDGNATNLTSSSSTTGITVGTEGSSGTNANLQPYVVVKMWKRTA